LTEIVREIRAASAPAVFLESTTNSKVARVIADETGARIAPELHTDSLGPPGSPAASYLGMFKLNVDTIAQALE
jgi:zinc/manganese transport system substrate-binding protein